MRSIISLWFSTRGKNAHNDPINEGEKNFKRPIARMGPSTYRYCLEVSRCMTDGRGDRNR